MTHGTLGWHLRLLDGELALASHWVAVKFLKILFAMVLLVAWVFFATAWVVPFVQQPDPSSEGWTAVILSSALVISIIIFLSLIGVGGGGSSGGSCGSSGCSGGGSCGGGCGGCGGGD